MARGLFSALALVTGLASAHLIPRADGDSAIYKLLVGASGQLIGLDFDGTAFSPRPDAQVSEPGAVASWMTFKQPNLLYAVDENTNATRLFNYEPDSGQLSGQTATWDGSGGVVHLTLTHDKTRLIGSSYGQGQIDVWDSSAEDGTLTLSNQIPLKGPDSEPPVQLRAHQSLVDPTGRFLLVNDLGGDMLHVFDVGADFTCLSAAQVTKGLGPRHGAFLQLDGGDHASHYVVVCETGNVVLLFSVSYDDPAKGLTLTLIDEKSTFGPDFPAQDPSTAAAGELVVSKSGAIYVSNRLSGNETDSISQFALEGEAPAVVLAFKGQVSSGGIAPRMISLSKDETVMFVTNLNGVNGLVALKRDLDTGSLEPEPMAVLTNEAFAPEQPEGQGFGPMFVMEF